MGLVTCRLDKWKDARYPLTYLTGQCIIYAHQFIIGRLRNNIVLITLPHLIQFIFAMVSPKMQKGCGEVRRQAWHILGVGILTKG